ncbi:MAG: GTP-binding protein [Euryarchaeota archaeon]|nr:GTP-binding protein [Euryarchaeota archaeon]
MLRAERPRSRVKLKLCLVGDTGVGKTSLIRRYVLDLFDDAYIQTLGAKVTKKTVVLNATELTPPIEAVMTIWDVMGTAGFRELLKESYFYGCQAILAVADVTVRESLESLDGWIDRAWDVSGDVPVHILVNKVDLVESFEEQEDHVRAFSQAYDSPYLFTSAKRGDNVTRAFEDLARRILVPNVARTVARTATP